MSPLVLVCFLIAAQFSHSSAFHLFPWLLRWIDVLAILDILYSLKSTDHVEQDQGQCSAWYVVLKAYIHQNFVSVFLQFVEA